jgi:hypothetical protein
MPRKYEYAGDILLREQLKTPAVTVGKKQKPYTCKTCHTPGLGQPNRKYCDNCSKYVKYTGLNQKGPE